MSSRRKRGESASIGFDDLGDAQVDSPEIPTEAPVTTSEFANRGYNSQVNPLADVMGRDKIVAKPLPITDIRPDALQPRRTIPTGLRHYWNGSPDANSMARLFEMWLKEVDIERGKPFDVDAYLTGSLTDRVIAVPVGDDEAVLKRIGTEPNIGVLEAALLKIILLAASIQRDGLTNPITVINDHGSYIIETGEGRWLAYHLLHWRNIQPTHSKDWSQIPARVADTFNLWRQASENNARNNLNAIARARQLARLLMHEYEQQGVQFQAASQFEHEQAYYAQVADGNLYPIPVGEGEKFMNGMGFKHVVQLRQYRALLRIARELWDYASDNDLTEGEIRKMVQQGIRVTPVTRSAKRFKSWRKTDAHELINELDLLDESERTTILDLMSAVVRHYLR
jgi:ParB-like chromosome segregation protein Spo0J